MFREAQPEDFDDILALYRQPLPQLMRELVDDDNAAQRAALAQLTG